MGVSFETYLRRRGEEQMGRRCYILLRRCYDIPIRRRGGVPLRHVDDISSRSRWVFRLGRNCKLLGRTERRHFDVATS